MRHWHLGLTAPETVSFVLSVLWWGFWLGLFAYVVAIELWARRPWRREQTFGQWYEYEFMPKIRRKVETENLAKMEAEGVELWKPDRARTGALRAGREEPRR